MSARYNSEYSGRLTGCSSGCCGYKSLGCSAGTTVAALRPGETRGVMVTPNYGSIGYDALTHGRGGGCGGYFNIQSAYGCGGCSTTYTTRLCGADCSGCGSATHMHGYGSVYSSGACR